MLHLYSPMGCGGILPRSQCLLRLKHEGPHAPCRVPDELRRHSLSDGCGGSYSTNLDRNRYGNDDQYLSTVIRYDLEFLELCPCMVDVEIIDAKNGQGSILVSADPEMCNCGPEGRQVAPKPYVVPVQSMRYTS